MINELYDDYERFKKCHERWMEKRNKKTEALDYKEEWYDEQCEQCKYFIPLAVIFVDDYGGCSNPASPLDGNIMFEHDGCEFFDEAES